MDDDDKDDDLEESVTHNDENGDNKSKGLDIKTLEDCSQEEEQEDSDARCLLPVHRT